MMKLEYPGTRHAKPRLIGAAGMKITHIPITKLRVTDAAGLDPIDVYVENVRDNAGHMTLTCFGKAWTAYWGNTGTSTLTDFILGVDVDYLANCLQRGIESREYDSAEARAIAIRRVLRTRRIRCISKRYAEQQYTELIDIHMEDDPWRQVDVMRTLLGPDWLECLPMRPNPDYVYLVKIIEAARGGLLLSREANHA